MRFGGRGRGGVLEGRVRGRVEKWDGPRVRGSGYHAAVRDNMYCANLGFAAHIYS